MCYKKENNFFQILKNEVNRLSLIYPEAEIDIDCIDPYGYNEYANFFYILLKKSIGIYVEKTNPEEIKYIYYSRNGEEHIFNSYSKALELAQLNI